VDHQEHQYGVDSKQTEEAVQYVDRSVASLVSSIDSLKLRVNYIFVSDHGMTNIDTVNYLTLPSDVDTNRFIIVNSQTLVPVCEKEHGHFTGLQIAEIYEGL
jgi:predicted AlkP superfamily pyrophosphatase or phosphodiesterase